MRTVQCNDCGSEIALDDFIICCCPVCDSFMQSNRLNLKVDKDLTKVIRVEHRDNQWQQKT